PNGTYYIKADGGGLNELHITNDPAVPYGRVTTTAAASGSLYVTNTGERGFGDDIVLLVSVRGPIPDDFVLHVKSSGYGWTPAPSGAYTPLPPTDYHRVEGGVDETFTKADFVYGPQTWKPSPGDLVVPSQPLYYGQDMTDPSTAEYLIFVDLRAGTMFPSKFPGAALVDDGAAKVEYSFTNLTTRAEFNGYGWCSAANQAQGISWTNPNSGVAAPAVDRVPAGTGLPADADGDGLYEDVDGNGRRDAGDAVLLFLRLDEIRATGRAAAFDFDRDGRLGLGDAIRLLLGP
ncbi:MAG TPA: hypothetical protein HA263_05330, partial [Methanoregulaceae archaeon]|nr:hypothetical protein [Methanoregulaceae archaeon]